MNDISLISITNYTPEEYNSSELRDAFFDLVRNRSDDWRLTGKELNTLLLQIAL